MYGTHMEVSGQLCEIYSSTMGLRIELRSLGLYKKHLYVLYHLASPIMLNFVNILII